ncbi:hypothetical protein DM02DRAFT_615289 [Periconia macrospinosa]|uniref:Polyketide cyclase/dehydrase n=1 Tax=Periconia macrospinosa TaxID=97972 RepID=A0A2V1DLL1_9PLEO|nr:hypothetical protein DM02DRAFT_615289 [Periconia macrospinosa]
MQLISTTIEIAAPPEAVREKFLDFPSWPKFQRQGGWFISIAPSNSNNAPKDLEPNDTLDVTIQIGSLNPTILENTPTVFQWGGTGLMGTFNGAHAFRFKPSTTTPGGTTFVHEEEFTGAMTWLIGEGVIAKGVGMREKTKAGFEGFNEDFKKWCEAR